MLFDNAFQYGVSRNFAGVIMDKIQQFQEALSNFSETIRRINGVQITHIYVDDAAPLLRPGDNPFKLILQGVKINHGKGN